MNGSASARITGLDEDLAALEQRFKAALAGAMPTLREDLAQCLFEHVQGDVYEKFDPKEYIRRGEYGGLADIDGNTEFAVTENSVAMDYQPAARANRWKTR